MASEIFLESHAPCHTPSLRLSVLARHVAHKKISQHLRVATTSAEDGIGWEQAESMAQAMYSQLTPEEVIGLIRGKGDWSNAGVKRLDVSALWMTDGPSGIRGPFMDPEKSTPAASVPVGIALGATWDPEVCREVGALLAGEAKLKGATVLLGPTVNLQRQPLGGRHYECFSEDPQLTAALSVGYIRGVQSEGIACCVKHFVCNDQEDERTNISSEVSERALREVYFPPFEAAVKEADCMSVMTGYNRVNGVFCSEHRFLLQDVLRRDWGFQGCIISDWTGTNSLTGMLEAGLDLEMPETPWMYYGRPLEALLRKDSSGFDRLCRPRALSVLRVMARLGLLPDPATSKPRVMPTTPTASHNDAALHSTLRRVVAESIVLLKNEGPATAPPLPLPTGRLRAGAVAVLGPTARRLTTQGGGSSSVMENQGSWDLVAALRRRFGTESVAYGRGTDSITKWLPPPTSAQLHAPGGGGVLDTEFVLGKSWEDWPGERPMDQRGRAIAKLDRIGIGYYRAQPSRSFTLSGPWSVRYRGILVVQDSGGYEFSLAGSGKFRLSVSGKEILSGTGNAEHLEMGGFLGDIGDDVRGEVELLAEQAVEICIEWAPGPRRPARLQIGFRRKEWASEAALVKEACQLAAAADTAIVVLGTDINEESEGRDQKSFDLKGLEFLQAVLSVQPNTVLCLNLGAPKKLPIDIVHNVAAIVACWLGGQEMAEGLAAVLCGEGWGPGGRLPTTWPINLEDGPTGGRSGLRYPGSGTQVFYSEELLVGHRWFESQRIAPLFRFGHGLSYTYFEFGQLAILRGDDVSVGTERPFGDREVAKVQVEVRNVGERPGKEVVQVFVKRDTGQACSWRLLLGFAKLALHPGESTTAVVPFSAAKAARYWDEDRRSWAIEQRPLEIVVVCSAGERSCGQIQVDYSS